MAQRRSIPGLAFLGITATGLLLAHWAAYVIAYRQVHLRDVVLAQTGHSYLATVVKLVCILLFVGLGWLVAETFSRRSPAAHSLPTFAAIAGRLIGVQAIGFSALEVLERVSVHAPVAEMFHHQTYVVGLILQALTALGGALLILLLTRAVGRIYLSIAARRLRQLVHSPVPRPHPGPGVYRHRDLVGNIGVRGPPKTARI